MDNKYNHFNNLMKSSKLKNILTYLKKDEDKRVLMRNLNSKYLIRKYSEDENIILIYIPIQYGDFEMIKVYQKYQYIIIYGVLFVYKTMRICETSNASYILYESISRESTMIIKTEYKLYPYYNICNPEGPYKLVMKMIVQNEGFEKTIQLTHKTEKVLSYGNTLCDVIKINELAE